MGSSQKPILTPDYTQSTTLAVSHLASWPTELKGSFMPIAAQWGSKNLCTLKTKRICKNNYYAKLIKCKIKLKFLYNRWNIFKMLNCIFILCLRSILIINSIDFIEEKYYQRQVWYSLYKMMRKRTFNKITTTSIFTNLINQYCSILIY